jgi:hypothetical protein
MHYAAQLSHPRSMLVPLVALVIGAGGAVGTYALLDDTDVSINPTRVIVTDAPVKPGQGVAAKNEAGTAAAVGVQPQTQAFGKDEAATAAALDTDASTAASADAQTSARSKAPTSSLAGTTTEPHIGGGPPAESRRHVPQDEGTSIGSDAFSRTGPPR